MTQVIYEGDGQACLTQKGNSNSVEQDIPAQFSRSVMLWIVAVIKDRF